MNWELHRFRIVGQSDSIVEIGPDFLYLDRHTCLCLSKVAGLNRSCVINATLEGFIDGLATQWASIFTLSE